MNKKFKFSLKNGKTNSALSDIWPGLLRPTMAFRLGPYVACERPYGLWGGGRARPGRNLGLSHHSSPTARWTRTPSPVEVRCRSTVLVHLCAMLRFIKCTDFGGQLTLTLILLLSPPQPTTVDSSRRPPQGRT